MVSTGQPPVSASVPDANAEAAVSAVSAVSAPADALHIPFQDIVIAGKGVVLVVFSLL